MTPLETLIRDVCQIPDWHVQDWNGSPELWCECGAVCDL